MLQWNDLLRQAGIAPEDVNVILHSPREAELRTILPALVRTRRGALEAYQSTHESRAEASLKKGRPFVASFVKIGADRNAAWSRLIFAGLYCNHGYETKTHAAIASDPNVAWLRETFGALDGIQKGRTDLSHVWFNLSLERHMEDLQGRLIIAARLTQTYVRLSESLDAPIRAILEHSRFDAEPPDWRTWTLSARFVRSIPPGWAARLSQWRGVYLIVDESDGARYVGSAYGTENILSRWRADVAHEAGVTVELQKRDPERFRFSILERTSPDAEPSDVIALEQTWMTRLHTREFGLNAGAT